MEKEGNDLEKSLATTISTSDLKDLSGDYAELLVDSVLKDGVLKEIPIVGSIVAIGKFGVSINNYMFIKKVLNFLTNIKEIPVEKRLEMINKIERSCNYQSNVGQALILIIDKLEDLEKPKVIGKLFTAVLSNSLEYDTFLRISQGIEKIFSSRH